MNAVADSTRPAGLSRRSLIKGAFGGLVVGLCLTEGPAVRQMLSSLGDGVALAGGDGNSVNSWLTIAPDNTITLTIGVSEMGQGSFSTFAQLMAEELYVDYARVKTVQGVPATTNPAPLGTSVNTVGSSVTRSNFWKVRDAAAMARERLVAAAMARKGDPVRENYTVSDGVILHTVSGFSCTYGDVAVEAASIATPTAAPLVPDDQLRLIGQTVPRLDLPAKVNGSAVYGIDVRLPGMLYAVIVHSPAFGGTLKSAPAVPSGMTAVVPTTVVPAAARGLEKAGNVNAVAVVGPNTWDTWRAAKSMKIAWNPPPNVAALNSTQFDADATALLTGGTPYVAGGTNGPGTIYTAEGDPAGATSAITASATALTSDYSLPYVAHACMEVLNCTVDYVPGVKCDIYAPTQGGNSVLILAVALTGLPATAITVHTTLLGGGLGRKWELDFISQAIQVGMAVQQPVKLMWPREEDFRHDQYRPMAKVRISAGLDAMHNVTGWRFRAVSPSLSQQRGGTLPATGDGQGTEAAKGLPYVFGSRGTEYVSHPSLIPVGYWRSVGASINTFAVESMIDELAVAAGEDPYLFRRNRLTDDRWKAVLDAAAYAAGWGSKPARGTARGIAVGAAFNSIVAEVVEIAALSSKSVPSFRVTKVAAAIDPGTVVNPGQVEHQIVGGVVHGMNAAMYGQQKFANGVAQSANFNKSRMIRLNEMPQVTVSIVSHPASRSSTIGGVGELGVPTFAPALANAYFALTGKRMRSLPFFPGATMGGL